MRKGVSELSAIATLYVAAIIATSTMLTSFLFKPGNVTSAPITTSIPITTSVESPFSFASTVESTVPRETTTIETETTIATTRVSIDCLGNPPHGCYDFQDIESIDSFTAPISVNCGETITVSFDWTGLHYGDKNYWGFFIDSTFIDSCETFAGDTTKYYTMSCSVTIPNNLNNGDHTIFVTGWGYGGYCKPYEAGQYSKEKSKIITLNNCQGSSNTSSSTTTTIPPGESSTSTTSSSTTTTIPPGESSTTTPCVQDSDCCSSNLGKWVSCSSSGICLFSNAQTSEQNYYCQLSTTTSTTTTISSGGGGGSGGHPIRTSLIPDQNPVNVLIFITILAVITELFCVYRYYSWASRNKTK